MSHSARGRLLQATAWFLAISYGVGAPLVALAEFRGAALSDRFGLPPPLIYLTCAAQIASAPAALLRTLAPWAALVLTATTVGAVGVHLNTESPLRAVPAAAYTALQIWFGLKSRARARGEATAP